MTIEVLLAFALAVGALAIKPGAGMAMTMSRSISGGWPACFAFVLGFCIVSILFLLIVIAGYQAFEVDLVFITILIKSCAAVYLIYLGFKGLSEANESLDLVENPAESFFDNLSSSIVLTLSNPLTIVFYAGILPTLIEVQTITFIDVVALSLVIVVVEYAVAIFYCAPMILFRKKMKQQSLQGLKIASSLTIILVGLYIGYTAIPAKDLLSVFQ